MSWVRSDDGEPGHPKIFRAGVAAYGFFQAAKCYCSKNLTDGFIPVGDLSMVFYGLTFGTAMKLAIKLVECGLFEKEDKGYRVHDYLHYNPSKEQVVSRQSRLHTIRSAAGKVGGVRSAEQRATVKQTEDDVASPLLQRDPSPVPSRPVPSHRSTPHRPPKGGDGPAGFQEFWSRYPKKIGRDAALKAWNKKFCEGLCDDILSGLERNMAHLLRDGGEYIPNPATWLNQGRWKDEPPVAAPADRANLDAARAFIDGNLS